MYYLKEELYKLIKQDNEIFSFLQEAALDGLWYWDLENPNEEWMNNRFWEVLGYNPEDKAHSPEAWMDIIFEEDGKTALEKAQSHFTDSNIAYDQVVRYRHKLGHTVWIRCRGLAIRDEAGKPIRMLGAHIDISKEKQTEQYATQLSGRFKSILDNQDIFVVRLNAERKYTYTNAYYKRAFAANYRFFDKLPAMDSAAFDAMFQTCLEHPGERQSIRLTANTNSGDVLHVKWDLVGLNGESDKVLEVQCVGVNLTEAYQAQKELEYTKSLLTRASRGARIGVWEADLKANRLTWSEVTREIHEVAANYQPNLKNAFRFYKKGKHRQHIEKCFGRLITSGESYNEDLLIVTTKNREVWVRTIGQAVMENGKCIKAYGTFQDIDSQKRDAIEKERWRQAIEQNQDEIYGFDAVGLKLIYSNKQSSAKRKISQEQLRGRSLFDFIGEQPKDDVHAILRSLLLEEEPKISFETKYSNTNGESYPVEVELQLVKDDAVNMYLLTARDISVRKAAEAQRQLLQSVVKNAQEGMFIAEKKQGVGDVPLRFIYINPAFEKITGFSLAVIQKQDLQVLQGPQTSMLAIRRLIDYLANQEAFKLELILYQKNGTPLWVQVSAQPILEESGQLKHWIGILRDISAQKAHERLLLKMRNEAETANKAKSIFLANMSHEIRTPLNGVIGFSNLLKETALDEVQQQYLKTVEQSASSLLDVINDILDLSKIEAGKMELEPRKVLLDELLKQVLETVKFQAHQKGLELLLNLEAQAPEYIWVDSFRLRQILLNLLSNAVKFTEEGEIELQVRLIKTTETREATLQFDVRDTGTGIAPDKQQHIFEAFDQADSSISRKYGGTGLGLAISQHLLEVMGASLQLKSQFGEGSTFFFQLTCRASFAEQHLSLAPEFQRVLLVEHNDRSRHILENILEELDVEPIAFSTAQAALSFLKTDKAVEAIIFSHDLSDMDGLALSNAIREDLQLPASSHPIVLLHNAKEEGFLRVQMDKVGINRRLVKPVNRLVLRQALYRLHRENNETEGVALKDKVLSIGHFRILVAEDNQINSLLVEKMLQRMLPNSTLKLVANGEAAVKVITEWQPDLILMDVHMPVMDGLAATKYLREDLKFTSPIIALTADTLSNIKERVQQVGMNGYLSKPFNREQLASLLQEHLSLSPE